MDTLKSKEPARHYSLIMRASRMLWVTSSDVIPCFNAIRVKAVCFPPKRVVYEIRCMVVRVFHKNLLAVCPRQRSHTVAQRIGCDYAKECFSIPSAKIVRHCGSVHCWQDNARLSVEHIVLCYCFCAGGYGVAVISFRPQRFGERMVLRHSTPKTVIDSSSCHK